MRVTKQQLYKRQTTLEEFGDNGQQKLQEAKIVIVGCGGLGSIAAVSLAASGIGHIHLIDFDIVDISNLPRQYFYKTEDVGKPKSITLANYIQNITPFVKVSSSNQAITKANVFEQINAFDLVVDCTDSLEIKYLLNDFCVLNNRVLVYGSLYKFDGYVASFNTLDSNGNRTANLRDAFPEIPKNSVPNCSEVGTLNTIVGIIGLLQANEVIKIITKIGTPLVNQIQIINSLDNSQYNMQLKAVFSKDRIQTIYNTESYLAVGCTIQKEQLLISAKALKNNLNNKNQIIISVIENEQTPLPFLEVLKIPLSKLDVHQVEFDFDKRYIIICNKGISSYIATQKIKEAHPNLEVLSLKDGISKY